MQLSQFQLENTRDTNKRPNVLETFSNVNLDPASPNYIKKRIGDRNVTIDANGKQTENGDYPKLL